MAEILIGIVSGVITGTGMGGGTILIALLTLINNMDQHMANFSMWDYWRHYRGKYSYESGGSKFKKIFWIFFGNNCYS